jgi:hypothetical protein
MPMLEFPEALRRADCFCFLGWIRFGLDVTAPALRHRSAPVDYVQSLDPKNYLRPFDG